MIRQLSDDDRDITISLLQKECEYNLYVLGNLMSIGFAKEDLSQFWGDFDSAGRLRAVLNRYMSGWVVFGEADSDWLSLGAIVDQHPVPAQRLQDNPGGIESFLPYIARYKSCKISVQKLMALEEDSFIHAVIPADVRIRRATVADLPALVDFYKAAGHMSRTATGVEQPLRRTRVWLAETNGEIRSAALTNAETKSLAMIGGVYTNPKYRGRGYSKAVCSLLCEELVAASKRPVLYWETAAAGAIYRQLGFHYVGDWRSVRLEPVSEARAITV